MPYISFFSLLVFLRFLLARVEAPRNALYPVLLALLFLLSAFRFEVGCDWGGYLNQFEIQKWASLDGALARRDPLWWGLMEITTWLGLPYPWLNVFSSAIFFAGVHVLARRQPDPLGFLVLLFPILIINMPMSAIAQAAAVGVLCVAFAAFLDRRLLRFVVWVVVASLFHSSALVFLLLAPLVRGPYTLYRLVLAALLAVPGGLLILTGEEAQTALLRYVATEIQAEGAVYRSAILFVSGLFFLLLLRRRWALNFQEDYKLASLGALIMLALLPLVPLSSVIADRLGYYLIPLQAMIFARVPYLPLGPLKGVYSAAPYLGLALVFVVWTSLSWHFEVCYMPYETWLFGLPDNAAHLF